MKAKITVISVCALVLMGLALAPTPADASVVKEGLVGYWTFDTVDVKGKTVKDAVGANDGTIDGSPTQTKGKVGQALRLGGLPEAVTVPSPADNSLNFGNDKDFTLMAWIQVSKEPEGGQSTIMSKGDGGGNNRFLLKVRDGGINLSLADDKPASVDIRSEKSLTGNGTTSFSLLTEIRRPISTLTVLKTLSEEIPLLRRTSPLTRRS